MDLQAILAKIDPSKRNVVMPAFRDCTSVADAKAIVTKFELPITDDEIAYFGKKISEGGGELSDDLLANVAGGGQAAGTVGPTITDGCW